MSMVEELGIYERDSNYFILVTGKDDEEGTKTVYAVCDTFGKNLILDEDFYDINDYKKVSNSSLGMDIALGRFNTDTSELIELDVPCDRVRLTCGFLIKDDAYVKVLCVIASDGIHLMDINTGKSVVQPKGWRILTLESMGFSPIRVMLNVMDKLAWDIIKDYQSRRED